MSTVFPEQEQLRLRRALHELDALPQDWLIGADKRKRITYQKGTEGLPTFTHPTLGDLPRPWIVRICGPGKEPKYFNTETSRTVEKNPRHDRKVLRKVEEARKAQGLGISTSVVKVRKDIPLSAYHREDVKTEDIREDYEIIKALDDPNSKTKIGAFNGGVFVVRHKKSLSLSVEKRSVLLTELIIHWVLVNANILQGSKPMILSGPSPRSTCFKDCGTRQLRSSRLASLHQT